MSLNPIRADAVHFGSVLSENTFEIPELQRPYAWRERQAEDFVNDVVKLLIAVRGPDGDGVDGVTAEHLFGTIVVLTPTNLGERASVIDGQQRLTTVSVTLGLIEAEMCRLAEQVEAAGGPQAPAIVKRLEDSASKIHERLWRQGVDANQPATLRLLTSPEIRDTYDAILRGEPLRSLPQNRSAPSLLLVDAATIIQDKLVQHPEFYDGRDMVQKQRHLVWLMNAILDQLLFVLISTPSNAAAYDLFEVLNARGEPLNTLDLLKTWIMATMADDPRRNAVYAKLKNLVEDPENQLEFLDDFFRARVFRSMGDYDPIPNALECRKSLFGEPNSFRNVSRPEPSVLTSICDKIVEQVDLMSDWFPRWKKLVESIWPYEQISAIGQESLISLVDVLGCKIARPLLLQSCARLTSDDFGELLHMVEKTFFRYKTVCSRPAGPLERVFYEIVTIIDTNKSLDLDVAADKLQTLIDQNANDTFFGINLDEFTYQSGAKARRLKYFLWMLDRYSAMPAPAPIVLKLEDFEIEHVAPKNPSGGGRPVTNVDVIGNLCILTGDENRELSNLDFAEKLAIVNDWKKGNSFLTAKLSQKIFNDHTSWGETEINGRTKALKHHAYKVFRVVAAE
jgi:hypothetical protein